MPDWISLAAMHTLTIGSDVVSTFRKQECSGSYPVADPLFGMAQRVAASCSALDCSERCQFTPSVTSQSKNAHLRDCRKQSSWRVSTPAHRVTRQFEFTAAPFV